MNTRFSLILLIWCVLPLHSATVLNITDYGVHPNDGRDAVEALRKALSACKGKEEATIVFPKGRYDFYPRVSNIGINISDLSGITIDGQGSEFIFHGVMKIALINSSDHITFRNFSVDWDRPFISQGVIRKVTDSYLEVEIDPERYPYVIRNGQLFFTGEDWEISAKHQYYYLFDKDTHEYMYDTRDFALGWIFDQRAEQRKNHIVRFHGKCAMQPPVGTIIVIRSIKDYPYGIDIEQSKHILMKDLRIHHSLSHAFFGKHSEDITLDNAFAEANDRKGRLFSSISDAAHFMNCRGNIEVRNCAPTGNGDDFLNVHGRYFKIQKVIDQRTVDIANTDVDLSAGEKVWFVDSRHFQRGDQRVIQQARKTKDSHGNTTMQVVFSTPLPRMVSNGDCLESSDWLPDVTVRDSRCLRKNRGRGILASTPGKIIIENNYFSTTGAAILIAGDMNRWYESGACSDVTISGNTFDNCMTSGMKRNGEGTWGRATITICPSLEPSDERAACYHHNIKITNNHFTVFEAPVLFARSVDRLQFKNNTIVKSQRFAPYSWQRQAFFLEGCREVSIGSNQWDSQYVTRGIQLLNTSVMQVDNKDPGFSLQLYRK